MVQQAAKPLLPRVVRGQLLVPRGSDSAWMLNINLLAAVGTRGNTVVHRFATPGTRSVVERGGVLFGFVHRGVPFESGGIRTAGFD